MLFQSGAQLCLPTDCKERTYMPILRGSFGYPLFFRSTQILRETGLPNIREAVPNYAENLRDKISNPWIESKDSVLSSHTKLRVCACDR